MSFRWKFSLALMLVVAAITAVGISLAGRSLEAQVARELQGQFQAELTALQNVRAVRKAALAERVRALVGKPRIHAALEDDAMDLLYPSARDELRDVIAPERNDATAVLKAQFYRFLDTQGVVMVPIPLVAKDVGDLAPDDEARLALAKLPGEQQFGYLARQTTEGETLTEVITVPIIATDTAEIIAALVLGFKPDDITGSQGSNRLHNGIWTGGRLFLPGLAEADRVTVGDEVARALVSPSRPTVNPRTQIAGQPYLLFSGLLNPGSLYPPAYEVCLFPLAELLARQRQARWQILGAGGLMLVLGLGGSYILSGRLARPVEQMAVDSELNRAGRERAESALQQTSVELQRSVRFSADASHQLKTPVTVLRAGLDELLAREHLSPELREEIAQLIHQTYRLTGIVEDLLLLSRLDAGRLELTVDAVDLVQLLEAELDDLSALPTPLNLTLEPDLPAAALIAGETRYTMLIVRNLLENARKYNRPGGRIRVTINAEPDRVFLAVGNTGNPIPPAAQQHIFERFHRGSMGENIPGHGLGLNLARDLAQLHGGDLRLVSSRADWTEFEVWFRPMKAELTLTALRA